MNQVKKNQFSRKFFVRAINDFINGGYLVVIGDISAICAFAYMLKINLSIDFLVIVFLLIFSLLLMNYYKEIEKDVLTNPERYNTLSKQKKVLPSIITFCSLVVFIVVYAYSSMWSLLFLILLFIGGALYTIKLKSYTKNMIGLKSIYVAFFYSMLPVFLSIYYKNPISLSVVIIVCFYFMRMIINTVFCDIRDIKTDKKEGLKTIAIMIGENNTINYLFAINLLSMIPIIAGAMTGLIPLYSIGLVFTALYATVFLFAKKYNKIGKYLVFNILAEGEFIFWLPYVLIAKYIVGF